jgi:hypothetical protein
MEKQLFYYIITIFIPTIFTLYNLGSIVYIIGEFKEHVLKVPKILIIFLLRLIFLSILQLHTFHYLFHNYIPENFYFVSIGINLYIMFEMLSSHKVSISYLKYLKLPHVIKKQYINENNFNQFILKSTKNNLKNNLIFFTFTEIFNIVIGCILILTVVFNLSIFNYLLVLIYLLIFTIKRYLSNFMSTL